MTVVRKPSFLFIISLVEWAGTEAVSQEWLLCSCALCSRGLPPGAELRVEIVPVYVNG